MRGWIAGLGGQSANPLQSASNTFPQVNMGGGPDGAIYMCMHPHIYTRRVEHCPLWTGLKPPCPSRAMTPNGTVHNIRQVGAWHQASLQLQTGKGEGMTESLTVNGLSVDRTCENGRVAT